MNQEIKETILNTAVALYCQSILSSLLRIAFLTVRVYFIILFDTSQASCFLCICLIMYSKQKYSRKFLKNFRLLSSHICLLKRYSQEKTGVLLNSFQECLVGCFWPFWYVYATIKFYTFHYKYRCLKNMIHQTDSKNGWLLLSASFTAKFGLVFVLTLENVFS